MNLETLERLATLALAERRHAIDAERYELEVHRVELELQNQELRRTEQQLIESVQRYQTLYEHAPMALLTLASDGVVVQHNARARELLAVDGAMIDARPLATLLNQETSDELQRTLRDASWTEVVRELEQPDGTVLTMRLRRMPHDDSVLIAITGHPRLPHGDELFAAVAQASQDGILTLATDGTIESANPASARMFGHEFGEIAGRRLQTLLSQPLGEQVWASVQEAMRAGNERVDAPWGTLSGLRANGTRFPVRLSVSVVGRANAPPRIVATIVDLTNERLVRQLRASEAAQGVHAVAGELNNMIMGVHGCIELARRELDPSSAAARYLEEADAALAAGAAATSRLSTTDRATTGESDRSLLVVTDYLPLGKAIVENLDGNGWTVRHAMSIAEARQYLTDAEFDALLADVQLPDGLATELVESTSARIPIVFMSGTDPELLVGEGSLPRDAMFVAKPFDLDVVVRMLGSDD